MITAPTQSNTYTRDPQSTDVRAMSIATVLFFMWGFLTCLNDILIPHLKSIFSLNYGQALLVQFAFFSSYFIFALPSGKLVDWRGYKQSMVIGLIVMAAGALLFLPAASTASFALFLSALVILAAGITCLQVLGQPLRHKPRPTGHRRQPPQPRPGIQLLRHHHRSPSSAEHSSSAPSRPRPKRSNPSPQQRFRPTVNSRHPPSACLISSVIAVTLVVLAIAIGLIKLPTTDFTRDFRPGELASRAAGSIWKQPYLLMATVAIFVYVGAKSPSAVS